MFLKSVVSQSLLRQINSVGAAVPLIQRRGLEKLRVPITSLAEQRSLVDKFELLTALESHVRRIRLERAQLNNRFWVTTPAR